MSLEDPLEPYRVGPVDEVGSIDEQLARDGRLPLENWPHGGTPAALTREALYLIDEGNLYRIRRKDVQGYSLARDANIRMMRWGLVSYLVGLPLLVLDVTLAAVAALIGLVLTTRGFLRQAILVHVKDGRVPPFLLRQPRWKSVRSALREWDDRARGPVEKKEGA